MALRDLHTDAGSLAQPSSAFESYVNAFLDPTVPADGGLSGLGTGAPGDPRASHMDRIFQDLQEAGWTVSGNPADLYLAWDFTTASTQNVTGRLLAIRDDAFGQLGETKAEIDAGEDAGAAPSFQVSSVTDFTQSQNPLVAREIQGTFPVPCYIAPTCSPPLKCDEAVAAAEDEFTALGNAIGAPADDAFDTLVGDVGGSPFDDCPSPGTFNYSDPADPDTTPSQVPGQTYQAAFICVVDRNAFDKGQLLRPVEYGHGLFGSYTEVTVSPQEEMADRENMMYCATDWFGWANSDIPNALLALANLSNFPVLADEAQQGQLDFLYLQRLMIDPGGFATDAAFQYAPGDTFIDLSDGVNYDGNSQGGIYGGTVCAVSIDARRCALGVNGMDYSTLLPRSVDYVAPDTITQFFAENATSPGNLTGVGYSNVFDFFYPDQAQRQLILDIIQTLWDRADPDGYASHMTASAESGLLPDCTALGVVPASEQTTRYCDDSEVVPGPDHHVLMQIAWGDHQVANITAFDEARTIGAESVGKSTAS
ncbi:MAG TPA: hypothetical protein VED63_04195, partial [Acidimicrobiales bacterium]|nr:hypothetical protein [Acidimicrobiales bacterium]